MTGKKPKLFNSNIPPSPKFYLDRILFPRHTISEKVFDEDAADIFPFTGLNEFGLGRLVKKHETSTSGEQLDSTRIYVGFMLLEQSNHFQEICKRESAPVHLLSYDDCGKLKWVKTCGRINILQRFVDKCQNQLTENDLLKSLKDRQLQTILIADSPGMGKSFLLANIAHKLESDGEKIVAFTTVNNFIEQFKFNSGRDKGKIDCVKITLENLICKSQLGNLELPSGLSASVIKIELLMDGFDEVSFNDLALALEIIKLIKKGFKSIRLWISTRPHHLEKLEAELDVLGYNIRGFDDDDQITFLISHWKHSDTVQDKQNLNMDRLTDYACKVLQKVKRQLNKDDNDIAGIPLQCFLIGEVFEEECINFSIEKTVKNLFPKIRINSISDLFKNMIINKFQRFIKTHVTAEFAGIDDLMEAHIELSLKLLFPEYNPKLNCIQVSIDCLMKIGIIQAGSNGNTDFIHRTFAEYFAARYVINELFQTGGFESRFENFFLERILMRENYFVQILADMDGTNSHIFSNHTIAYFINANISSFQERLPIWKNREAGTLKEIYQACANSSFLQIFKLFTNQMHCNIDVETILLVIRNSTCEYFKFVLSSIGENLESFENNQLSTFLRVAVQRSEPEILNYILKNRLFLSLIEDVNDSTKHLLHDCVSNTKYKPEDDIAKRIGVVQLLFEINPDLLEKKDSCGRSPLLCEYVHVDLLKKLIQLGADIYFCKM